MSETVYFDKCMDITVNDYDVEMEVTVNGIECESCGSSYPSFSADHDGRGDIDILAEPCQTCLELARKEGEEKALETLADKEDSEESKLLKTVFTAIRALIAHEEREVLPTTTEQVTS